MVDGCYYSVSDLVLEAMTPPLSDIEEDNDLQVLVPRLRDLTIAGDRKQWSDRILAEMIVRRRSVDYAQIEGVSRLERICIGGSHGKGLEDLASTTRIEELCKEGLIYASESVRA